MSRLQATFVRTAIAFLVAGLGIGALQMAGEFFAWELPPRLGVVQTHFLTVGFATQMIMGVALWMFPVPPGAGRAAIARSEPYGWAGFAMLDGGLLIRAATELTYLSIPLWLWRTAVTAAVVLQVTAAVVFTALVWERTRPRTFIKQTTAAPPRPQPGPDGLELDLREHAEATWASAVLQVWPGLRPGQALVLVAGKDPRAMVNMLHREQPGRPPFTYLERGPARWRVRIEKPVPPPG